MSNDGCFFVHRANKIIAMFIPIFIIIGCVLTNYGFGSPLPKRKYIFIDGGADVGQVFHSFQAVSTYLLRYSWEIFAIDANPDVIDLMPRFQNLTILNKAIWIEDGTITFYLDKAPNQNSGASLFEKNTVEPSPITIESMDFSQWIKRNFAKEDYIILIWVHA